MCLAEFMSALPEWLLYLMKYRVIILFDNCCLSLPTIILPCVCVFVYVCVCVCVYVCVRVPERNIKFMSAQSEWLIYSMMYRVIILFDNYCLSLPTIILRRVCVREEGRGEGDKWADMIGNP